MKSKFLTRLLTGALFAASVSSFVSCKDYDDEINNLQNQINKAALQEDLNSLSSTLTTSIRNAKAAADAAQETAEDAFSAAMLANANAEGRVSQAQFDAAVAEIKAAADALGQKQAQDIEAVTKAAQEAYANAQQATSKADSVAHKAEADAAAAKVAAANAQKAADDAAAAVVLLASQVQEGYATKAQLEEAKAAAQRAADAAAAQAKEAADAAEKAAKAYADLKASSTLGDAKSYADGKAAEAADEAKRYAADAISKALSTYDEAATAERNTAIAAAIAKALAGTNLEQVPSDLQEQLEKLSKMQEEMAKNTELLESVDTLKQELSTLNEETIKPMKEAVELFKQQIKDLYQAVTSVELVGTVLRKAPGAITLNQAPYYYNLDFLFGKMKFNEWFGNNEHQYTLPQGGSVYSKANDSIRYINGQDIRTNYNLLVRVSPVTATFTKEQVKLLDSQKNDLSEIVTIEDPKRYEDLGKLITTRAQTDIQTGLWIIPVKVKDGVTKAVFNRQVYDGGELYTGSDPARQGDIEGGKQIAYAVVITNTEQDQARYAVSSYDIATRYVTYEPANFINLKVNGHWVRDVNPDGEYGLHNRWAQNLYNANSGNREDGIQGEDNVNRIFNNPELAWKSPGTPYAVATSANTVPAGKFPSHTGAEYDAMRPFYDYRNDLTTVNPDHKPLEVEVGKKFTLSDFTPEVWELGRSGKQYVYKTDTRIEYYYVTLDLANAIESNPNEQNDWQNFDIEGLKVMTPADDDLEMTIKSENAAGDWIGFRFYAVNYDGSLVDPDGIAFYVHVAGDPVEKERVDAQFTATYANAASSDGQTDSYGVPVPNYKKYQCNDGYTDVRALAANFTSLAIGSDMQSGTFTVKGDFYVNSTSGGVVTKIYPDVVNVAYELLQSDKVTKATNWNNIAYIHVAVDHPEYLLDNGVTAEEDLFHLEGRNNNIQDRPIVNELYIGLKKVMPTSAPSGVYVDWRAGWGPSSTNSQTITVYPRPFGWVRYRSQEWNNVLGANVWVNRYDADATYNHSNSFYPTSYRAYADGTLYSDWQPGAHNSYYTPAIDDWQKGMAYEGYYGLAADRNNLSATPTGMANNLHSESYSSYLTADVSPWQPRALFRIEIANASDLTLDGNANKLYLPGKYVRLNGSGIPEYYGFNYVEMEESRPVTRKSTTINGIDNVSSLATTIDNYTIHVPSQYIDGNSGKHHEAKVYYYYRDISLTQNDDGQFVKANYMATTPVQTFNISFNDILATYGYAWLPYSYTLLGDGLTTGSKLAAAKVTDDVYWLKWSEDVVTGLYYQVVDVNPTGSPLVHGTPTYTTKQADLTQLVKVTPQTVAKQLLALHGYTASAFETFDTGRLYDVNVTVSGGVETYYNITGTQYTTLGSGTNNLKMQKLSEGLQPAHGLAGRITITGKDIFGKTVSVYIPVKIYNP